MSKALIPIKYNKLVSDLSTILEKGKQDAMNAVNDLRLQTYWKMGQRMAKASELSSSSQINPVMSQLAKDLKMDLPLLYRVQQFYRLWPKNVPVKEGTPTLSWSHFVEMLSIKNPKERDYYFAQASSANWSRDILRKAIAKDFFKVSQEQKKLPAGTPLLKRPDNPLHTYQGVVEKVVDGDTLLVRIDLGFEVWVNQRTRFRGINTAEIVRHGVPTGQAPDRAEKAKIFVQKKLEGLPFVVIKTYKTDMYGRYVVDLFYHPTLATKEEVAMQGFFLNEELLKVGLADLMM